MKKRQSTRGGGARLGQHFLTAPWAASALAKSAHIQTGSIVLEIGPGKGALTKELLREGATVIAIEKDPPLVAKLNELFNKEIKNKTLTVVEADIRDVTPETLGLRDGAYSLAANIPYYITGEILRTFLTAEHQPHTLSVLIQKEVAQRIATSKKESILSLSVKAYGIPRIVAKVPKGNFSPAPSVDSAILCVENINKNFFAHISEERFFECVHAGFASKRKMLASNLKKISSPEKIKKAFEVTGLSEKIRAEDVPLQTWSTLVQLL